ncbi:MAG: hypothetical protein DRO65_02870 [Candidatus Altiarchaeales archaeon]|nr:MAG: hypothetical protein DRO65_02870 [Candidatus Altiarchaeales archaeon]
MSRTIVLCIDRDNDIGEKLGVSGPIIGIRENINIAKELALKDPEDTDVNAIFGAVKIARETNSEVVTLTGDKDVGIKSDKKIAKQLERIIQRFNPESVILVTDGVEDEQIIPIVQSRIKIESVKTIVVRQSIELERAYFRVVHFIREIEKDPELSRLVFGVPGVAIIILSIGVIFNIFSLAFGIMLAMTGFYFLIKGFGYEEEFFQKLSGFYSSFSIENITFFSYALSFILLLLGLVAGYQGIIDRSPSDITESLASFLKGSIDFFLISIFIIAIGHLIDNYLKRRYLSIRKNLILMAFIFFVYVVMVQGIIPLWLPGESINAVSVSFGILGSFLIFLFVIYFTNYMFMDELKKREEIIKKYLKKVVYTSSGTRVGNVSKVLLDGTEFLGVKVGTKKFEKEDILIDGEDKIIIRE